MGRFKQAEGKRGSLKWIQRLVNDSPEIFDLRVSEAAGSRVPAPIQWRSPLRVDDFAEYRDSSFLERLGVTLDRRSLASFWPARGPQWDALGVAAHGAAVLVEAKAHIDELISPPCQASPASLDLIRRSLSETARFLKSAGGHDWSHTFYQYANRLAHLYLLRELNAVPAWLVFVSFVGDVEMDGPRTAAEWRAATRVLLGALGLKPSHPLSEFVLDVHVEVTELPDRIT